MKGAALVGSTKILAVDDEPDFEFLIRQRFRREIRDDEFAFRFARHGREALSALGDKPDIDLIPECAATLIGRTRSISAL